ncbi:hypothetical protein AB0383_28075 [Amycolatopsis sp. NPDC051373]|uniref:hypothetical protein n=1 Tax=Amycolatopsis sp. NPDC051373 TaxID=3155801 RepID=UPI00344F0231
MVAVPLLPVVLEHDSMAPSGPALRLAATAPSAELHRVSGGPRLTVFGQAIRYVEGTTGARSPVIIDEIGGTRLKAAFEIGLVGAVKDGGGLAAFATRFRRVVCECRIRLPRLRRLRGVAARHPPVRGRRGSPCPRSGRAGRDEVVSVPRQREDYRTAVGWVATQPALDASRIVVCGMSFAGLHVVDLAVTDRLIAGAIGQTPLVDAVAAAWFRPASHCGCSGWPVGTNRAGRGRRATWPAAAVRPLGGRSRRPRHRHHAGLAVRRTPDDLGRRHGLAQPGRGAVAVQRTACRNRPIRPESRSCFTDSTASAPIPLCGKGNR